MGLFDKKFCDFCGNKIGMFGNRKLEDGNMCSDCASQLSPWFNERRHSTVEEIKEQLAYREANKEKVAAFHPTKTIGKDVIFYVDETKGEFTIATSKELKNGNPDIIHLSEVTGCELDVKEDRDEVMTTDKEGNRVSYHPPRYSYEYDFTMIFNVNNPYFDQMKMKLNNSSVKLFPNGTISASIDPNSSAEYKNYINISNEIKAAFKEVKSDVQAAAAPKQAVTCPCCGASTIPDANGCCEYCGSSVNG